LVAQRNVAREKKGDAVPVGAKGTYIKKHSLSKKEKPTILCGRKRLAGARERLEKS